MQRRKFLESAALGATALFSGRASAANAPATTKSSAGPVLRYGAWLAARHKRVTSAADLDAFLQPPPNNQWAKFDPELGYVPKTASNATAWTVPARSIATGRRANAGSSTTPTVVAA